MPSLLQPLAALVAVAAICAGLAATAPAPASPRALAYQYRDTRELVNRVEAAAALVAAEGRAAFARLSQPGAPSDGQGALFIYQMDGVCALHPGNPALVGQNLLALKDVNGKPVVAQILDIGRRPEAQAWGWVSYLWAQPNQFTPAWQGAYVRKAVAPSGEVFCVGSGVADLKLERVMVQQQVDAAAELLSSQGPERALGAFRDPASTFNFMNTYLFVLDAGGRTLVDPAFPGLAQRDLSGMRDAIGHPLISELLGKLQRQDRAWAQYLSSRDGAPLPTRKRVYLRKVQAQGATYLLGADFVQATPIWMHP